MAVDKTVPRVLNPLWIISLFLGLAEVTAGGAATLTSGWIQSIFAIFCVTFPSGVAIAFFITLRDRPQVFYAPGDFLNEGPDVQHYIETMSKSLNRVDIEKVITVGISRGLEETPELGEVSKIKVLNQAIESAKDEYTRQHITVRIPFVDRQNEPVELLFLAESPVSEVLDNIYFALQSTVAPYTYGDQWILRNVESGEVLKDAKIQSAMDNPSKSYDYRPLSEAGIPGGSHLEVLLFSDESR
ncbi:hypothetical protein GPX89_27780 [Nocardia sp. ET3-3]|uniref:Uncharacterized protein n=1 Tax=Nocardia terrae TaxID=2675851 RepID=A0A7K1V340_9NOCA|nr:hypothetical protein [Nocardia terrae]MVU81035.1 hypothetical protein [Nocardia terrae]